MNRFPDFGRELQRPFEVHENCYDCGEFYDGCNAWPAGQTFRCADYLRLPDVLPGTCGQVFPPSRMNGRKEPREIGGGLRPEPVERQAPQRPTQASPAPEPVEHRPTESDQTPTLPTPTSPKPQGEVSPKNGSTERLVLPAKPTARICGCGAPLPKGKRLCDTCRTENRRQTKRQYMRTYMTEHRPAAVRSDPDMPFAAQRTHATQASGGNLRLTGLR